MLFLYILSILARAEEPPEQEIKRYSIIHGRVSTIQVPIENVFSIEIHPLNKTLNNTKEGQQPTMIFADFCQAKNPLIYLKYHQSMNVCAEQCEIIIQNNRIYSLLPSGYLKVLEMNDQDQGFKFFSETLIQSFQNLQNIIMAINVKDEDSLIVVDGLNLTIVHIELNHEYNLPISLQTQIQIITQAVYWDDLIYIFGNNTLEIFQVKDQFIELINSINLLEQISITSTILSNVIGLKIKNKRYVICHTENLVAYIQLDDSLTPTSVHSIHFEGKVINVEIYEELIYVIQKFGNKINNQQFMLEYEGMALKQNLSLSTKVNQVFSTQNYIIVLQENLIQLAFAKIETKQLFSKNILENTNKILAYSDGNLILQQQNEVVTFDIMQQQAQLVCEPNLNYSTGTYMMELRAGFFQNETKSHLTQLVELVVYVEIFENGNVGLYVGLTIGLAMTFITIIIFCVFFYKLKAKYQFIGDEHYQKNPTEFTME